MNLDGLLIPTPNSSGAYIFSIKYNNADLFKTNITVSNVVPISDIIPKEGVALVNNTFFAIFDSPMNQTAQYIWTFGDSANITTTEPRVSYKFESTGTNIILKLTMITNGGSSTKSININVYTPDQGFNRTIKSYREGLANFSAQLNSANQSINAFAKSDIESQLKLADLKSDIDSKEKLYFGYLNSQETEKLRVMKDVLAMKVPKMLYLSQSIQNSKYLQSSEKISFSKLEEFGAGTITGDEEDFKKRLNSWIDENVDLNFESKTYNVLYSSGEKGVLFSDMVFTLVPKADLSQLYFVIDSPSMADKVKISNSELKSKEASDNGAVFIDFKELLKDSNTKIEFLYPTEISIKTLPVYLSPDLKDIGGTIGINTGVCNHDKICGTGEDYTNCPGDCKPWGMAIILIVILLIIALVIYIIMQEWYKRHYESYLFTNKVQLYNLINFMYNSSNQGTNKADIFSKLKDQSWNTEQLDYAWKKFKGQRVGMWEIPVFKWMENKQVKSELIKRNPGMGKNPTIR